MIKTITLEPLFGEPFDVELDEANHASIDGKYIGRVEKSTRTYSPPTHRGSRIAKYHKSVPCWRAIRGAGPRYDRITFDTRKAALMSLAKDSGLVDIHI